MKWQHCVKWLLVHCIPNILHRALQRAVAQNVWNEWLTELIEVYRDLHLSVVPNIRRKGPIHMKIVWVRDFNKSFLSFSYSQYFLYKFPEDVDSVIIKVVSEMTYPCAVVSVQNINVSLNHLSNFQYGTLNCPRINEREGWGPCLYTSCKTAKW